MQQCCELTIPQAHKAPFAPRRSEFLPGPVRMNFVMDEVDSEQILLNSNGDTHFRIADILTLSDM